MSLPQGVARLRRVEMRTVRQEVSAILRDAILTGDLEPGQRLVETTLAEQIGVGRLAVREALGQLEQQGLVVTLPNRGARVIEPTMDQVCEAVVTRFQLEGPAIRLAALRGDKAALGRLADVLHRMEGLSGDRDPAEIVQQEMPLEWEFHQRLVEASGSAVLCQVWSTVSPFLWAVTLLGRRYRGQPWPPSADIPEHLPQDLVQHRALLEAMRNGDADRAEAELRAHLLDNLPEGERDPYMLAAIHWPPAHWAQGLAPSSPGPRPSIAVVGKERIHG